MFTQHFGLKFNPFTKEIDEKWLYDSAGGRELSSRLEYMTRTRGFFLLTADAGIGKTTALRRFAAMLDTGLYKVCYSALSSLTVQDFYRGLVMAMGAYPEYAKVRMFAQLQELIITSYHDKRVTPVFILDEAQALSHGVLEDLRMLFNFKMDSSNPFILILSAHHIIRNKLQLTVHQALRQRFVANYHMSGLSLKETGEYLTSRFKIAGAPSADVFENAAIEAIHGQTNGCPRLINNLADATLKLAAIKNLTAVDSEIVLLAARDIEI
jgi:type II secretory pathway predicted ATPase ExeA